MSDVPDTESVRLHEEGDHVTIEVTVAAPVATVWEHLRDPALIARWHGWDYPGLDEEIGLIYGHGAREGQQPYVLETKGGAAPGSFEHGDRFDLREEGGGTVVRITRGPKGADPEWDAMYDDITEGWTSFLAQLRFAVERQHGRDRRTVFLAGGPAPQAVRDLLATAPQAGGTQWFRTDHQTGLVVDAYGPGLVVAMDKPAASGVEASMVIVSTFGLDAPAFAEIERSWTRWWAEHRPEPEPAAS